MKKHFQFLSVLATIFHILAIIGGVVALLASLVTLIMAIAGGQVWNIFGVDANTGFFGGLLAAFLEVLTGIFFALILYGYGELINLLLALEENTYKTAQLLEKASQSNPE